MVIVVEGLNNEEINKHCVELHTNLKNCRFLCGSKKNKFTDWVNELQNNEYDNTVIVNSWLSSRAENRIEEENLTISNDEAIILNTLLYQKGGHIDYVTGIDEASTMEQIKKDRGCNEDYAKKVFNSLTYEVLQAKVVCLVNAIKK